MGEKKVNICVCVCVFVRACDHRTLVSRSGNLHMHPPPSLQVTRATFRIKNDQFIPVGTTIVTLPSASVEVHPETRTFFAVPVP